MRILILSKACLVGTYQTKLEEIASYPDVDLTVIVPPSWDDPSGTVELERVHTDGYDLIVDPIRFNGNFHLHYYPQLKKRISEIRPDILHIDEEPYNLATWRAWRLGRAYGAKTLFFSWQNIQRRYPFPFSLMEQQVLQGVDYAIMGNQDAVSVWHNKGYHGPHQVIPQFGVNPDIFSPAENKSKDHQFRIGSANRRLVPEKGIDTLIRAAAGIPGEWQIQIMGDGPEKPNLIALAKELGIASQVHFEQTIASGEMPSFLSQLDVLVLSSRAKPNWKEQFGRVLIEAMACETPVIGSDSGEIPNVIGDAGLIFPEDDVAALRSHLLKLIKSNDLRLELGQKGRKRVLSQYTQAQIAAQTVDVYREMMQS